MKEGWSYKKVGDVCNVYAGQGAPQGESNYSDIGIPFVKAGNLGELTTGTHESEIQKVSPEVASSHGLKLYKKGSVLFAKSGMSCMKGYIYTLKTDCYVVSHLAILEPQNIDSKYLQFYLRYKKPYSLVKDEAYPSISLKDIENMPIIIPNNKAQEGLVVTELDNIDKLINHKKSQLKDLDLLTQSLFFDMFGDPVKNEKKWEVKRLSEISSLISNGNTPKGGSEVYVDSGYLFLRSQNVWKNRIDLEDVAYIDDATHKKLKKSTLMHNDLLITKTGRFNTENSSLGRTALFEGEDGSANINGHVYLVRLKSGMIHKFVLYILISDSYRDLIRKTCVGGIDKRQLNKDHIEDFPIIFPPIELQSDYVKKVELIEKQKQKIGLIINDLETLLASRMQYWFG